MKHLLTTIMIIAIFSSASAQAQWTTSGNDLYNTNYSTGKVAIGLTPVSDSPSLYSAVLQVRGKGGIQPSAPYAPIPALSISGTNVTGIMDFSIVNGGGIIDMNKGTLKIVSSGITIAQPPQTYTKANLYVPTGIVTIGNVTAPFIPNGSPAGGYYNYGLYVEKGILTEKIKIAVNGTSNWADYVFDKNYKLLSLNEVEAYVIKNKHLPDVPSAEEVVAEGIDVLTMDAKLLQKIEELTLYMIEMQKEIEALQKENLKLKK